MVGNNVETVTLTIETGNGELHRIVVRKPGPQGGNPAFMWQQVEAAIGELGRRSSHLMDTYGAQIEARPSRSA